MDLKASKTRLISVVSLIIVAGFLVTSLAAYFVSADSAKRAILESELPLTGDNVYSEIQRDLLRPVFISSLMASDTFLRDWVLGGEGEELRVRRYLKEIMERYDTFTAFFVKAKSRSGSCPFQYVFPNILIFRFKKC